MRRAWEIPGHTLLQAIPGKLQNFRRHHGDALLDPGHRRPDLQQILQHAGAPGLPWTACKEEDGRCLATDPGQGHTGRELHMADTPVLSIALANLAAYTAGDLIFAWLELPAAYEQIQKTLQEIMVSDDPRPDGTVWDEYFVSDFQSRLIHLDVGEYEPLEDLNDLAEALERLDDDQLAICDALLAYGDQPQAAIEQAASGTYQLYRGLDTWEDLAEYLLEENGALFGIEFPEDVRPYLDYEALGRDLKYSGEFIQGERAFIQRL